VAATDIDKIRELIIEVKPEAKDFGLEDSTPLFDVGALDSYSVVVLIQRMEESLGIVFDYSDLRPFNFESLGSILNMLKTKYELV
jgi:acyl carrier protein